MAIYRGIGGAGDSNTDATVTAVTEQAVDAAQSATEAATSATQAATSAASASSSATNASSSASSAATSATNAASHTTAAANSATSAATSATAASVSETNAAASETAAATSETNAAASEASAETDAATATTKASEAATSATNAATSATSAASSATASATSAAAALVSETNAAASETAAASSESNAASSETAAAASAIAADASANDAASSEANAAASETASAASAASASTSATTATTQATAASTSASAAATSASNAATSESNAATSETNASASESAAASSATAAQAAQDAALAALDSFDDRYLGQKASDPSVDNDGDALVAGALYFNTTDDVMKVYEGSSWVAAYASLSGALLQSNNLSDLQNVVSARTNLGLGTAATTASTDYATAAQGVLADSAIQAADLGTAAYTASTDYATAAQGALADSALQSIPDNYLLNTGDAITGNLTFGDNDKAIFGNGSDLQIYHNGSASVISDTGTGNFFISGDNDVFISKADLSEVKAKFSSDGAVTLYHDNSAKLATTSTGIEVTGSVTADAVNVTGTATMDGLTVDNGSVSKLDVYSNGYNTILQESGSGSLYISGDDLMFINSALSKPHAKMSSNGDISFYEDTGTTAKFFWDASAESLGIGTSSPTHPLTVVGTSKFDAASSNPVTIGGNLIQSSTSSGAYMRLAVTSAANPTYSTTGDTNTGVFFPAADNIAVSTAGSERMRIDSSGNLLVGTTDTNVADAGSSAGININGDGEIKVAKNGTILNLNRLTADGEIVRFKKDGSTVGSIGTIGSDVYIGSGGAGVRFYEADNSIIPCSSAGVASNGAIDIGDGSFRFKDLYLSGDAYIDAGYGSSAKMYGCRAWVNFNGTGTVSIRDSGGVSSITDEGTGRYRANFTTNMPDRNWAGSAFAWKEEYEAGQYRWIATGYKSPQVDYFGIHTGTAQVDDVVDAPFITAIVVR